MSRKPARTAVDLLEEGRWVMRYVLERLRIIDEKETTIMALQDDLNARVTDLTNKTAAEHQQVAEAITALEAEVQALKDAAASGGTLDFAALDAAIAGVGAIFEPTA